MKIWKNYFLIICGVVLLLSATTASAVDIDDGEGDVYHWTGSGTSWHWELNTDSRPNIDIAKLSYVQGSETLTISMEVSSDAEIEDNEQIVYWLYYNTSDATYYVMYSNGESLAFGMLTGGGTEFSTGEVTKTDNVLSATFDLVSEGEFSEMWGWAAEYSGTPGEPYAEWWGDWAPNSHFTGDITSGDGDSDGDGDGNDNAGGSGDTTGNTPGFELIVLITALAAVLLILRRRK